MADLKIYNNGENKVLMSAGDRIIRQPYEFGNAFVNAGGLNNYILIDNLNIVDASKIIWHNKKTTNLSSIGGYITHVNDSYCFNTDDTQYYAINSHFTNIAGSLPYTNGHRPLYFLKGANGTNNVMRVLNSTSSDIYPQAVSNIKRVFIGAAKTSIGDGVPNYFSRPQNLVSRVTFFNREIPAGEWNYYTNNNIGSEFQSMEGIDIDIFCNFAEILDFSSSQNGSDLRVGCRDYSGFNRHGQIMNLPVGSLSDQLAFANANLFVPFIQ